MTQHGPCGCDHEEETKQDDCCGGGHCHDEKAGSEEHACCGGGHCHNPASAEATDETMEKEGDHCGCGHEHGHSHELSAEDMQKLRDAIAEAGYQIEETPEGDIRILEK
jgi:hypothetical protein